MGFTQKGDPFLPMRPITERHVERTVQLDFLYQIFFLQVTPHMALTWYEACFFKFSFGFKEVL
jgi:hypothetical protein